MKSSYINTYLVLQLHTALAHLKQIDAHADSEHLHQYRVALRRFRSILEIYAASKDAYISSVKKLLKASNSARESDVFLRTLEQTRHPKLYKDVCDYKTLSYNEHFSKAAKKEAKKVLKTVLLELSRHKIPAKPSALIAKAEQRYKEAKQAHKKLQGSASPKQMHKTRIAYKQARYALEFLHASHLLHKPKRLRRMKVLLEQFGNVQDSANQLQWLQEFCQKHPSAACEKQLKQRKKALTSLKASLI